MRLYVPLCLAAFTALTAAAAAAAAPRADMNDATYLAVARCAGMAQGVGADATPFTSALDAYSGVRTSDVIDRAEEARRDAKRDAAHEGPDGKAGITQKLDTTCKGYVSAG